MSASAIERAAQLLGPRARRDVPLQPLTTYKVGGRAGLFVDARTLDDLAAVAAARAATEVAVLVVGRGSNMLVSDAGFGGIAVSIAELCGRIDIPRRGAGDLAPTPCTVAAGGGVSLPVLARRTAAAGLTGFEWAVGVPGSVGGAVRMNAGGHGSDMAACLVDVDVVDLGRADGAETVTRRPVDQLGLRFRASALGPDEVVLAARLRLSFGSREAAEAEIDQIVRWRREHQPGGQNCGSVFVNPIPGTVTAGELIDAAGLRGFRIGTAWVSEKHANFIQASPGGRASDVRAVIEAVRARVAATSGFRMRSEVRLVGFDDTQPTVFDARLGVAPAVGEHDGQAP